MSTSDEWRTPERVHDQLPKEFNLDSDPAPFLPNSEYGLKVERWGGRVFVNPPYSQIKQWVRHGYEHAK
jgi:hypothetical protein